MNNVQTKVIAKHIQNLLCFVETQQAVVDEYASQVFTDSAVQQHCGNGGIHATREAEDDFIVAYLLTDAGYSIVDNFRWRPQGFTLADITHKTLQHAHTLAGVSHFRVELYAIEAFFFVGHDGKRAAFGAGYGDEVGRDSGNFIAVAHPDIEQRFTVCGQRIFDTANQCAVVYDFNLRVAKFTFVRGFNVTAQLHCHGLQTPNTGTPASKTYCGARGLFSSVVLSGPPERIMPLGLKSRICASVTSHAHSSQ